MALSYNLGYQEIQCILQGVRFLLANHTQLSPTSENDSYLVSECLLYGLAILGKNPFFLFLILIGPNHSEMVPNGKKLSDTTFGPFGTISE